MSRRIALIVAGVTSIAGGIAGVFANRKATATTDALKNAVEGKDAAGAPVLPRGAGVTVSLNLTGYWPYSARPDEQKMEGGITGAAAWHGKRVVDPATGKRAALITVEMHRSDPSKYSYVSLSGDPDIWPWGQKVVIPWSDGGTIIGRVVDTGQHFTGAKKVFRVVGREPIDVCVASSSTKVIAKTNATVVPGDHWDKQMTDVALAKLGQPTVAVGSGFDLLGAV